MAFALTELHRNGAYAYWWKSDGNKSVWWAVGQEARLEPDAADVYFPVHPLAQRGGEHDRGSTPELINCVYADFDGKDFRNGRSVDYGKKQIKEILEGKNDQIQILKPSVVVDSGGGYHVYWILDEPFYLHDEQALLTAVRLQRAWVLSVGADKGASDLKRVLRVPGTKNTKYIPARIVQVVPSLSNSSRRYSVQDLIDEVGGIDLSTADPVTLNDSEEDLEEARKALDRLADWRRENYDTWLRVGFALSEFGDRGLELWDNWSSLSARYEPGALKQRWNEPDFGCEISWKSLRYWAQEDGVQGTRQTDSRAARVITPPSKPLSQVTQAEIGELMEAFGYELHLNLAWDEVWNNGRKISDIDWAKLWSSLRDHGYNYPISLVRTFGHVEAEKNAFHPVQQYLEEAGEWDGEDHIGALASHVFSTDNLFEKWFRYWIVGAVARAYEETFVPVLVLSGPQGAGKSYLAKWLCADVPHLFNEAPIAPNAKDCSMRRSTCWIWEVGELETTTRKADRGALKWFLSQEHVKERKAYGYEDTLKPVLCSYIGTVNNIDGFLNDPTGYRRFMVVEVTHIDFSYSTAVNRKQLWAQALHIYKDAVKKGETPWLVEAAEDRQLQQSTAEKMEQYDWIKDEISECVEITGEDEDIVVVARLVRLLAMKTGARDWHVSRSTAEYFRKYEIESRATRVEGYSKPVKAYHGVKLNANVDSGVFGDNDIDTFR